MKFNFEKFRELNGVIGYIPPTSVEAGRNEGEAWGTCGYTVPADSFDKLVGVSVDGKKFQWVHKDFRK